LIAQALARRDAVAIPPIIGTSLLLQLLVGLILAVGLLGTSDVLVTRGLRIPPSLVGEATRTFQVIAAGIPLLLLTTSLRGALEANQSFLLLNLIRAPLYASYFLAPVIGLYLEWDFPAIFLAVFGVQTGAVLAMFVSCRSIFRSTKHPWWPQSTYLGPLAKFGGWLAVSGIVAPLLVYVDRFLVARLLSIGSVAFYSAPYEIVTRLWLVPSSLVATIFPAFGSLAQMGRWDRVRSLATDGVRYLLLVMGPLILLLIAHARDVTRVWLGEAYVPLSSTPLQILSVGVLVNSLAYVPYAHLQAVGRPDLPAKFHLVEVPLQVALAFVLINSWGISGAALAWSVRVTLDALLLFGASGRRDAFVVPMGPKDTWTSGLIWLVLAGVAFLFSKMEITFVTRAGLSLLLALAFFLYQGVSLRRSGRPFGAVKA
jgi:O-antigen/teichoic acid export membrane protein